MSDKNLSFFRGNPCHELRQCDHLQLKNQCKDRGLRISGNKSEVIIRLMEDDESKTAPAQPILHQPQVEMMQQQMEEMKKIMIQNQADKQMPLLSWLEVF